MPPKPLKYISANDAAGILSVDVRTIRTYIADGRLPGYRVGPRTIRVLEADVLDLVKPIPTTVSA